MSDEQTKPKEAAKEPIVIKKYANRRLYNTATSAYVTLEDLSAMVRAGQDFAVYDAKTGEEITRSVLTQIIFEEENKTGAQTLLPINFLRQLIRFYGDQMQGMVPGYLEMSLDGLMKEQEKFRKQMMDAFGGGMMPGNIPGMGTGLGTGMGGAIPGAAMPAEIMKTMEEQTRKNMAMFQDAMKAFNPFLASMSTGAAPPPEKPASPKPEASKAADDFETLKQQMAAMQQRLETLARK